MELASNIQLKADYIVNWLKKKGDEASAKGAVLGVSGGVDSALCLALCVRAWPFSTQALVMPCHSDEEDIKDALLVVKHFPCQYRIVDLSSTYDTLLQSLSDDSPPEKLALSNLKPRLRMLTLYYYANLKNYLVVGTGNKDELYVGYFTKYGDGGVDVLPLGDLTKSEVREMALHVGVPEKIVWRVPSAGLWKGQTDESEMGISYDDLDAYLKGRTVQKDVADKIEKLHEKSQHKRRLPPIAVLGEEFSSREG